MNTRMLALATRFLSVAVFTACTAGVAVSDDTEIFTGDYSTPIAEERPNVLFIIDTSGSMGDEGEAAPPYDPNTTYSGACQSDRIYFTRNESDPSDPDNVPDCSGSKGNDWVPLDWFKCDAAMAALNTNGFYIVDPAGTAMAQWRNTSSSTSRRWRDLISGSSTNNDGSNRWVECKADAGVHGDGVDTSKLYAADNGNNNSPVRGPWSASAANKISWTSNNANRDYVIWHPNYVNYYNNSGSIVRTKLEVVQDAAIALVNSLAATDKVNVALMRYSSNGGGGCSDSSAEGGMVLVAMDTAANNQTAMVDAIGNLNASGCTPLAETLWEAYSYLAGAAVDYGNSSQSSPGVSRPSVASSRKSTVVGSADYNIYKSPLLTSCQNNFIIYLTDGMPTADRSAESKIESLIGAQCTDNSDAQGDGRCLDDLARYMYENDLRPTIPGTQNVVTYTIGFGEDVEGAVAQLQETANGAGGTFYEAANSLTLTNALTAIATDIFTSTPTSFTAPAVSINAFNRTQNLNDLYVSIFKPEQTPGWPGNLKKYRIDPQTGDIVDAASPAKAAVDPTTGFFKDTAISYWSDEVDGGVVTKGGAAHEHPTPALRNVYSNLDTGTGTGQSNNLTDGDNAVSDANVLITNAMLGLATGASAAERTRMITWLRGGDVDDDPTQPRYQMGDPLHGRPATVIYGGTVADPDLDDGVVYSVTNAGYLHAISVKEGTELWSFVPKDLLTLTQDLYQNEKSATKIYGLDGDVKAFKYDVNNNGIVEPNDGDKVYLFIGMGRGGSDYYALDVTNKNAPVFMWKIGPDETGLKQLPGAGQSWSTPALARVQVGDGSGQNALGLVLIMGGGYDTAQDSSNGAWVALDTVGNQIFMVDAVSGNRLWYASNGTSGDLDLDDMDHSIPADVRVIDITGDGLADRMYAADMGGRIWRFDVFNGEPAATLVAGGVFASLGNAHESTHPTSTTRKFYNAPDVALLNSGGHTWINIAIGSGYRGHPLNTDIEDRFYSLRDHMPLRRLTQSEYEDGDVFETITHDTDSLTDVTAFVDGAPVAVEPGAAGWYLDLQQSGSWTGEKVLSEARTVANLIQFPTWEPSSGEVTELACEQPAAGLNRLYTVSAFNAAPVIEQNSQAGLTVGDRSKPLEQSGIAPEVVWLFPSPDNPEDCVGAECRPTPRCLIGVEKCPGDITFNTTRTFWTQNSVN